MFNSTTNTYQMKRDIINFSQKICKNSSKPESKFVTDMIYGISKSKDILLSSIADSLDENIKKTQNSKWKKENIMLKKRLKNRNLSYYYDYTLINNFMNQDFQYLLSLIFCIILVIK